MAPLTQVTHKEKIKWDEDAMKAFKLLKNDFTTTPMQTCQNHFLLKQMFQILLLVSCYFNVEMMNDCILLDSTQGSFQHLQ